MTQNTSMSGSSQQRPGGLPPLSALKPGVLLLSLLLIPVAVRAQQGEPAGEKTYSVTGQSTEADGWLTAQGATVVSVKLPAEQGIIRIRGKSGKDKAGIAIGLKDDKGAVTNLGVRAEDMKLNYGAQSSAPLPDAVLKLAFPAKWPNSIGTYFVRPNMELYSDKRRNEVFKTWNTLPAASERVWTLELRRTPATTQLWFNGQFMSEITLAGAISTIDLKLAPGAALAEVKSEKAPPEADLLPLPTATYPRPGAMADAVVKLAADAKLPPELALPEQPGASSIAINGLSRIPARSDDLVSFTWRRSAVDALSETRLFSVPLDTYSDAQMLCAADEDPAKVPSFTARLTRYGASRGDAMADTTVTLPGGGNGTEVDGTSTRRVGEVTYGPAAGRKTVPLWLVRVPLKNGLIEDLLHDDKSKNGAYGTYKYLEFELTDPVQNADSDDRFPPVLGVTGRTYWPVARSSVHVFAAALERSPATLDARPNVPMQVFYASDKPEWRAAVQARVPGTYTVQWEFADIEGKTVAGGKQAVTLSAAKPSDVVTVPVTVGNGWYATRFQLLDARGEARIDERSSFVCLPPDTRKAGFESPFGTWWFHWAHGGEPNIEAVGPLLQRAGLRHSNLPESLPEAISGKYGVTAWAVNWKVSLKPTMQEMMDLHEAYIRKQLALWPSLNKLMVWHESGANGAPQPSEMWGVQPPPMDEKAQANWKFRVEYVTALAKMVRAKFPGLKLQFGNDGNSMGIIAGLLRSGFPREYIDTIATEDLGQTIVPERPVPDSLQSLWYLRQTARSLGYDDIPLTAAYEWMNRRTTGVGLRWQAEWQIRDALHAEAYGLDTIALGSIHDAGTGYYHSLWGAGGLTRRYPRMEPKPIYAAIATHTQVMDGAKFQRDVPTGLLSLYLLEYKRGNEWVYALWTPRGERAATLKLAAPGKSTLIDLYGRTKDAQGAAIELNVTSAPQYVVTSNRMESIVPGKASFPEDPAPKQPFIVDAMNKAANWTVTTAEPAWMDQSRNIPHTTPGNFTLREVNDDEVGPCLELELKPKTLTWAGQQEFVMLKLNTPVTGPGPYKNAGFWVKGNGGWGEIKIQVQADKTAFPTPAFYSFEAWSGKSSVSFDGWNFMSYPVGTDARWTPQGTVTGLIITMPQNMLHLTEMQKVPSLKLRFKGLSVY